MQDGGFRLSEFEVARSGERTERVRAIRRRMRQEQDAYERRVNARSMGLKIAICTVALLLVIAAEVFLLSRPEDGHAVTVSAAQDEGAPADDTLGKLKFVGLNSGAQSVFSIRQRWMSPVVCTEARLSKEDTLLTLAAGAGERVSLPAAGEVREIFSDETLGSAIRINHGNALVSVYYGVSDVRVEEGQPLLAADTLGVMPETGEIHIAITQSGTALKPTDIIDPASGA